MQSTEDGLAGVEGEVLQAFFYFVSNLMSDQDKDGKIIGSYPEAGATVELFLFEATDKIEIMGKFS